MKITTIALATALAMTSTLAIAQMGGANGSGATVPERSGPAVNGGGDVVGTTHNRMAPGTTTGMGRDPNGGNPNGTADGPTSLSGTGSSQYGGNGTAGTTNGR